MTIFLRRTAMLVLALNVVAGFAQKTKVPAVAPASAPIKIAVDASRAPDKILHSTLQIPVKPGPLTLYYPKWIPGEHGPTGPIVDLTGLQFFARNQRLTWRRNLDEMYSFELTVPEG